jgi:3-hydroxybutyryl-CoA dehydrogenase
MEKIGVYGAGVIGSGEAMLVIAHSQPCVVIGRSEAGLARCRKTVEQHWNDLIAEGLAEEKNKTAAMKLLTITNDPAALEGCTFVFEAVAEDPAQKKEVFAEIEKYAAPNAIIASCTSSLNSGDLAKLVSRPENLLVAHPLQPVHMMPVVEVVGHEKNAPDTLSRTLSLLKSLDREPVTLSRSVAGFLVNRFQQALYREAIYLIEQGVTTAEDINLTMKYLSLRYASIGLLEYFDDVGLPLESTIALNIYPDLCAATEIQPMIQERMDAGHTGKASGYGVLDWSKINLDDYRYRKQAPFFPPVRNWNMPE